MKMCKGSFFTHEWRYMYLHFKKRIHFYISIYIHTCTFCLSYRNKKSLVAVLLNIPFPPSPVDGFQMQIHSHYPSSNICQSLEMQMCFDLPMLCSWELDGPFPSSALSFSGFVLKWYLNCLSKFSPLVWALLWRDLLRIIHFRIWARGDILLWLKAPSWGKVVLIVLQPKEVEAGGWAK